MNRRHNGMIDRRPALIARCTSGADVKGALANARAEGLMKMLFGAVVLLVAILTAGAGEASAAIARANEPAGTNGCVDDAWAETSSEDAPSGREGHAAVWTGTEMIVWGGAVEPCGEETCDLTNTGGRYDPATDSWTAINTTDAPSARYRPAAVWTGTEMIVWGGCRFSDRGTCPALNTGGRYDPVTDTWTPVATTDAPSARYAHTAVWTGTEMIVWGGLDFSELNTGGRYDPATDTWGPTSTMDVPGGRFDHTAVWAGTEMIVWGGNRFPLPRANTGGRYDPAMDTWEPTSTMDAPRGRFDPKAVWTGTEMLVWGGWDGVDLDTGGRYCPATDTWAAISTDATPSARSRHTAVWTGAEMLVWGGGTPPLNTGGRYDPGTDAWTPTTLANAPDARNQHTAVWTGNEMIVWGGFDGTSLVNTGGRYCAGGGERAHSRK